MISFSNHIIVAQKCKTFKPTWTHLIKAPFDWAISPPVSYFPSRKQNFHPEVFLSVGLSLEIIAIYIPVSSPCSFFRCSYQIQASIYSWMSQSHDFSFTWYASQNYSYSQSPVPITDNFFHKRLSSIYAFSLPFSFL